MYIGINKYCNLVKVIRLANSFTVLSNSTHYLYPYLTLTLHITKLRKKINRHCSCICVLQLRMYMYSEACWCLLNLYMYHIFIYIYVPYLFFSIDSAHNSAVRSFICQELLKENDYGKSTIMRKSTYSPDIFF